MCQLTDNNKVSIRQQLNCILIDNVQEKLSDLLQRRLKEVDISKAELSRLVGVSRSYITNMVNATAPTKSGQYEPSPEIVEKLAKHLLVSQSEILDAIGYETAAESALRKPTTPAEFFEVLDKLGLDIQFSGGRKVLEGLDEDDLQELLDGVIANATAKGRRKQKARN